MTFAEKLKKARMDAGYTQEELADLLAVSRAAVAKWESNRGMPDVENLKAIAKLLNTSMDELLDDGSQMDLSVTRKPIDLAKYGDTGKLSRLRKVKIKEQIIRDEYPEDEIVRLTVTKIHNTKKEAAADAAIGLTGLLVAGLPIFGTQEFGKTINSLDEQYYLVNTEKKQYFVLLTDEYMTVRTLANPITDKKFVIGDREFLRMGIVEQ